MRNGKPKDTKFNKPERSGGSPARPVGNQSATTRPREKGVEKKIRPIVQTDSFIDELKNDLLAFFQINDGESFTQEQVLDHFDTGDRKLKLMMYGLIAELVKEKAIIHEPNGNYHADADANLLEGVVDHVNSRFAFVVPTTASGVRGDRNDDIWVSTEDLNGAVDGDRVRVVRFSDSGNRSRRVEGKVANVVERGRSELVGRIEVWPTYGFVVPDSKKIYEDIFIPKEKLGGANNDEKVIVRLTKYPAGGGGNNALKAK